MNRQDKVDLLIKQMGQKWIGHRDFKQKPRSYLPMPNVAGVQPCISHVDTGLRGQFKALLMWVML
jgi:hypothetical protein